MAGEHVPRGALNVGPRVAIISPQSRSALTGAQRMKSRREFLHAGVAGAIVLGVAPRVWSEPHPAQAEPFYKVIFDERFPASAAHARALGGTRMSMHGIRGDVTSLWYRDLYFQWKKQPAQIAGVTTRDSLFCLEILARDAGLFVITRQSVDNDLVLWSIGPRPRTEH
jgi:hypothetical protein